MESIGDKKDTVTIRAVSGDEEGKKRVEKVELNAHDIDKIKYLEKKLVDKGVQRMERHPADGLPFNWPPPKAGHGRKYTWEGPVEEAEAELDPAPAAIDKGDPNYVEEDEAVGGKDEVAKTAAKGVARVEVDPRLEV